MQMLNNKSEKKKDDSSEKEENAKKKKRIISFNIYINIEGVGITSFNLLDLRSVIFF